MCIRDSQYSEYNEGGDVSYEMSEEDIRTLGLLNLQILMIYITIYAYIILYNCLLYTSKTIALGHMNLWSCVDNLNVNLI